MPRRPLNSSPCSSGRRLTPALLPSGAHRPLQVEGAANAIQKSGESLLDREVYIESTTERQQREPPPRPPRLPALAPRLAIPFYASAPTEVH